MRPSVARNKDDAMYAFNLHQGNLKFRPLYSVYSFTEKESLFSYAISKFQHLVIFENDNNNA